VTAADEYLERDLAEGTTDPSDFHPSLAERIAAVEHLPAGEEDTSLPASELIDGTEALERDVARFLFGADATKLEATPWADVGERVYVPHYEKLAEEHAWMLDGVTFATLPETAARIAKVPGPLQEKEGGISAEEARALSAAVLGAGGVLSLRARGWSVSALPGQPVLCSHDDHAIAPHLVIDAARAEDFDPDRYRTQIRELGIEDVALERPATVSSPGDRTPATA
jgi:hypothetical protein